MSQSPRITREIPYAMRSGASAVGDLFLPAGDHQGSTLLLIHGGGWKALAKEQVEFLLPFFLERGHPVFNVNYRLTGETPWPGCGDDCREAGRFLLSGALTDLGLSPTGGLIVCGTSAGGHLAMMTGLRLPRETVRGILSLAGPSRIDWLATNEDPLGMHADFLRSFFGRDVALDGPEIHGASPALCVATDPPPLHCLHSRNDLLVPRSHSESAVAAWRARGGDAEMTTFDGLGNLHGFWTDTERPPGTPRPEVGEFIRRTLEKISGRRPFG